MVFCAINGNEVGLRWDSIGTEVGLWEYRHDNLRQELDISTRRFVLWLIVSHVLGVCMYVRVGVRS